jgi:hypothetical protein
MLVMCSFVFPKLVRVVFWGELFCPTTTRPKSRLAGLSFTTVPVPFRLTFCGLPGALSVTDNVPVRCPRFVGVKIRSIPQYPPGGRLELQLFLSLKSPVAAMLVMSSVSVP